MKRLFLFITASMLCFYSFNAHCFTKSYMCFGMYADYDVMQVPPQTIMYAIFTDKAKHIEMGDGTHWNYMHNVNGCRIYQFAGAKIPLPPGSNPQYAQVSTDYSVINTYQVFGFPGCYSNIRTEWRFCGDGIVR